MRHAAVVAIGCASWACMRSAATPPAMPGAEPLANKATASSEAPEAPRGPWAKDLFGRSERIGREVAVDIVEPMLDAEHSSGAQPGEYDVMVRDVRGKRLVLAPGMLKRLPGALHPPVRVRGTLEETAHGVRVRVAEITPERFPAPERLGSAADLMKEKARWSGHYVQVEDDWTVGFEMSLLGSYPATLWIEGYDGMKVVCEPEREAYTRMADGMDDPRTYRVRVTGFAYTTGRYGHLGLVRALIVASEVVFLDPSRPGCDPDSSVPSPARGP